MLSSLMGCLEPILQDVEKTGGYAVAGVLMKKGASFTNIMILLGAWSITKISMILFESSALGARFAYSRLVIDVVGIICMAGMKSVTVSQV